MLDAAIVRGLRSQPNVARWKGTLSVLLPKRRALIQGHHPAMPYKDVPEFMARMKETGGLVSRALQFLVLTALRKGEVLRMQWGDIVFGHQCGGTNPPASLDHIFDPFSL